MSLYISFEIAGWVFEFSIGFTRQMDWAKVEKMLEMAHITGYRDEDGNFVPEGVGIEDPEREIG
jgi:hypothetical protein